MPYVLNCVYLGLLLVLSPALAYAAVRHGKYRDGLAAKLLGRVPKLPQSPRRIWFHAVSVGEVNLLAGLIQSIREADGLADTDIVISTTTQTGFQLATRKYADHTVFYCPLDFSWAVKNAMDRIQPTALCLAELELWPNLLLEASRRQLPVAIVNGRLSDRSTRGYRRLGSWMRWLLSSVKQVAAQSDVCAQRFVELGVAKELVYSVGSLKFDGANSDRDNPKTQQLAKLIQTAASDVIFVAGSTQAPEESLAIEAYKDLRGQHPELRLILVPRHPERFDEVDRLLRQHDLEFVRRSELSPPNEPPGSTVPPRVILVDTIGELGAWWGCADIGFVGGSMGKRGGQNMIEPAAYGVATIFGPNTKNFRGIVEQLLDKKAAEVVHDGAELRNFVERCLQDAEFRVKIGKAARELVATQTGSTARTVELLRAILAHDAAASGFKRPSHRRSGQPLRQKSA